jgi:hypothetical protein
MGSRFSISWEMYQYEISSLHFSTKFDLTVVILEIKGVKGTNTQNDNLFIFFFKSIFFPVNSFVKFLS